MEIPRIISVDDHVVEPPDLWTARAPASGADRAPRVVRQKVKMNLLGGYNFEVDVARRRRAATSGTTTTSSTRSPGCRPRSAPR